MKSLRIHGPLDLRIENYQVDNLGANQVEIHIAIGGICGTDLHYYKHGGFGQIKLREPMILGHEVLVYFKNWLKCKKFINWTISFCIAIKTIINVIFALTKSFNALI